MKKISSKEIEKLYDQGINVYIRWSRGPKYDRRPSRDYLRGRFHAGLSAVKIGNWTGDYLTRRLAEYRFLRLKDHRINPYIYRGVEVGLDSDGYELIDPRTACCFGRWDEK